MLLAESLNNGVFFLLDEVVAMPPKSRVGVPGSLMLKFLGGEESDISTLQSLSNELSEVFCEVQSYFISLVPTKVEEWARLASLPGLNRSSFLFVDLCVLEELLMRSKALRKLSSISGVPGVSGLSLRAVPLVTLRSQGLL